MPKIKIFPQNQYVEVDSKRDLFSQLKARGFHINSTCGGCASCGKCIISIVDGEEHLNEIPFEEKRLLGNVFHITKERLSCQTKAGGPITIDISMHEQKDSKASSDKSPVKRRSKEEVSKIKEERREQRKERPKKLGGGKKPKAFNFRDDEDSDENSNKK
ncbi:MAG: 2Fe-2S iron-sulfur cluster-binding protein [Bacteriovoracaceae bacterium]